MKRFMYLFLFIPIVSFSQNDFRKMNWGESPKKLKEKYINIQFRIENEEAQLVVYSHSGRFYGVESTIRYIFDNGRLAMGVFTFAANVETINTERYLLNFFNISDSINTEHLMIKDSDWIDYTQESYFESLESIFKLNNIRYVESCQTKTGTVINHIFKKDNLSIIHVLGYVSDSYRNKNVNKYD